MRKMLLLKGLCDRQERKHAWIQDEDAEFSVLSAEAADQQLGETDSRDDSPTVIMQRNKEKQMRKMLLLKGLCDRQERKHAWIQQKVEKKAQSMLEKELRKLNMKSNVEHGRGQK